MVTAICRETKFRSEEPAMSDAAAFQACFTDWRLIKGRKVVQVVLELPIEHADQAYQALGGMPDPGKSIWCAVARLQEPRKITTFKSRSWHEMSPAQQAGMLCQDDVFAKFLAERDGAIVGIYSADRCAERVRAICGGLASRKDIKSGTKAEQIWRELVSDYRAWVREPEVVG
jgi:hypothetical protein